MVRFEFKFDQIFKYQQLLMNAHTFQEKPIRLVTVTEEGKYIVDPDGANFLSQLEKPIGVVSVAGLYRTGKSYLLNRMLLNKSSGFGVGSTINACTKGLWCWGTPIKGTTPDGQKINVIIIDSQGIGALDEDQNHDTKIFTLAVLSATTFIYNSVGSIDQNALQNLSLVVNLSKNIQVNSHSQDQEVDPEELAQYFPNFCWIVRDFSLQLINGNGDTITSNEYLQRSLALQKGFSDDIQDKNRIRRLLTAFFKNRQCITMVRPLVNQTKLQQLQKLELDELRPEFVEQVLGLRKRILMRLNPKKFKGQILDGKMYLNTLNSYVNAINQGAVPNMENAWSYMCQQKCILTFDTCVEDLQKQLNELQEAIPHESEQLNKACDDIEEEVLRKYLDETKGMEKQGKQLMIQLKQKTKQRIQQLKKKNEKQSLTILKSYAFKNFQSIEKMMATGQFSKYQDYIKELNNFYASLLENGPNLPNKEMIFLEFIKKASIQGAQLFLKSLQKSIQAKKSVFQQQKIHLNKQIQHIKSELARQALSKKQQLQQMDEQNSELLSQLEMCKQQLVRLTEQEQKKLKQHEHQIKQKKQSHANEMNSLLKEIKQVKGLLKQVQKQKYELQKQTEKSKAIHELKEEQYLNEIEEYKRKQTSNIEEIIKMRKDSQSKYEKMIAEMENRISEYKKKIQLQNHKKEEMTETIEQMQNTIEELRKQNALNKQQGNRQIKKIQASNKDKIQKYEQSLKQLQVSLLLQKQQVAALQIKISSFTSQSSKLTTQIQERHLAQNAQFNKEKALFEQKITFLEIELRESEETNKTNVQFYESRIAELQVINREASTKFSEQKLREIKDELENKLKTMEKQLQEQKYQSSSQIQILTKEKQNTMFELSMQRKTKSQEVSKFTNIISTIEQELSQLKNTHTQSLESKRFQFQTKVNQLQYRIKQLQLELQNTKQLVSQNQLQENSRSQEAIMQLKNYYELEKQRLDQKSLKEKEKYEKKLQDIIQQYEEKLKEETNNLQEEYEFLKEEFMSYQMEAKQTISMLQHELDLKIKAYDGLEVQYTEQKVFHQKKQIQLVHKNQFLAQSLNEERQSLQKRVDDAIRQKSKMQKQVLSLAHQKQQFSNICKAKDQKLTALQLQISEVSKQIQKNKLQSRSKQSQLQNEFMEKIINYEKKIALNKQQNEFLLKKNQEIQKFIENKSRAYEEKIQVLKEQIQTNLKSSEQKRVKEVGQIEEKYERLKKSSKQAESSYSKRLSSIERQFAIQQQKCFNLETRLNEHKSNNVSLQQKLSAEILMLKNNFNDQKNALVQKIQQFRHTIGQLESQKQAHNSEYEKEVILLENKIKYLEESRQKVKKQTTQKLKKFEESLSKAEKQRKQDKSANQSALGQQIKKMQRKYQQQLKQTTLMYEKRQNEWQERFKLIEAQNRKLSQKVASSSQFNSETYILQDRRLNELQQNQKKLVKQLQSLKNSSKSHSNDTFMLYQKEKQNLKTKLNEKQEKLRQAEKLKQEYFYELEKQKAKTNVQKESYVMKIEELKQNISKYERDLEKYQRQNEKLKVEKRASVGKIQLGRYSVNKSHFGLNSHTQRSGLQQSMSFLNVSVTSSIRDNKQGRSFSKMNKQYLKSYQASKQGSQRLSEKNSEKERDKQNFNPILDEESFFGNYQ